MYLFEFNDYAESGAVIECFYCGCPLKYSDALGIGTIGAPEDENPLLVSVNIECPSCGNIVNVLHRGMEDYNDSLYDFEFGY